MENNGEEDFEKTLSIDQIDSLAFFADLPITLSVEFGHIKLTVDDFLSLKKGSVIELSKLAGEPLELKMNGSSIALCEAYVQGDHFAVRLTDLYIKRYEDEL